MRFPATLRPYVRTGAFLPYASPRPLPRLLLPVARALRLGSGQQTVDWDPALLSIDGRCHGAGLRAFELRLTRDVEIRFAATSLRTRYQQMKIVADVAYAAFGAVPAQWIV